MDGSTEMLKNKNADEFPKHSIKMKNVATFYKGQRASRLNPNSAGGPNFKMMYVKVYVRTCRV